MQTQESRLLTEKMGGLVSMTEGHNVARRNIGRQRGIDTNKLKIGDITENLRRNDNLAKILD